MAIVDYIWYIVVVLVTIVIIILAFFVYFLGEKSSRKKKKVKLEKTKEIKKETDLIINPDIIKKKDFKDGEIYYQAKTSEYFKRNKGKIRKWLDNRRAKKNPTTSILVKIALRNGRHIERSVVEDPEKGGFIFNKGRYIFDEDAKYYIIDSNIWAYDYAEGFAMPIKRIYPLNTIRDNIEASALVELTEVEHAVNTVVLERFIKAEIAQGILRGASLGALFKLLVILVIIALFVGFVDLILDLWSSGIIQDLQTKV